MKAIRLLVLAAVVLIGYGLPVRSHASPPYSRTVTYYTGCPGEETAVGGAYRSCNGQWSYWGTQTGDWKEVDDEECYGNEFFTDYYVHCDGVWYQVDYVACPVCITQ